MTTKPNITELTKKDVLISEKNECVKFITKKEIDIMTLERTDPEMVVGRKEAARDKDGNVISYTAVKASEMLVSLRGEMALKQQRLNAIEILLKEEK